MKKKLLGFLLVLCVALLMLCTTAMADVCQCIDTNGDCICDTCRQPYHSDANTDHACDNNCGTTIGTCTDDDFNGQCDYGCGKHIQHIGITSGELVCPNSAYTLTWTALGNGLESVSDIEDNNLWTGTMYVAVIPEQRIRDLSGKYRMLNIAFKFALPGTGYDFYEQHAMFWGHPDTDTDDLCDSCGKHVVDCTDGDGDFRCDGCGEHVHHDTDQDHNCNWCGAAVSKHEDKDYNHLCDLYGAACGRQSSIAPHADGDGDHLCDYCGEDCHTDANKDHTCETCGETVGVCEDTDLDGKCDYGCGLRIMHVNVTSPQVICPDSAYTVEYTVTNGTIEYILVQQTLKNYDGYISKEFIQNAKKGEVALHLYFYFANSEYVEFYLYYWGHPDSNDDHKCDACGKAVSQCADTDGDCICETCKQPYHTDANTDHACDNCGENVGVCADNNFDGTCDYGCGKTFTYVTITSSYEVCPQVDYNLTWNFNKGSADRAYVRYVKLGKSFKFYPGETLQVTFTSSQINDVLAQDSVLDVEFTIEFNVAGRITMLIETFRLVGKHHDSNDDHKCDACGTVVSQCTDTDGDCICDTCKQPYHSDANKDHLCDNCGTKSSDCVDDDFDGTCDYTNCGDPFAHIIITSPRVVCPDSAYQLTWTLVSGNIMAVDYDMNGQSDWDGTAGQLSVSQQQVGRMYRLESNKWAIRFTLNNYYQEEFDLSWGHTDGNSDHKCDSCGVAVSRCLDANKDHICDYTGCNETVGTCADPDLDHKCDYGCGKTFGTCADTDTDHKCDYGCGKTFGTCADTDTDHKCDYGCGKTFGTCADPDLDHKCDYGCGKTFGTCADTDTDHKCDYGCGKNFGECSDPNHDHKCDYGCGKTFGECSDPDLDHKCDYGCGKDFGACEDTDTDHKCDYGCGKTFGECSDPDLDHKCDYGCGKDFGTCADTDTDHLCDYGCGKTFGECADPDLDHKCDYGCGKPFGTCADPDLDHKCDYGCGKPFATCADIDTDHLCDYGCGKTFATCADIDTDHLCDYGCGKTFGTCADPDLDHKCDYGCGKTFGTCADPDLDHKCDYGCGKDFGTCADPDLDHKCDYGCGKTFGTCADTDTDHLCDYGCGKDFGTCADPDLDHKCDYGCGKPFGTCADPDLDHKCDYGCGKTSFGTCADPDLDHKCDYGCGKTFGECSDPDHDHLCDYGCGKNFGTCADPDHDHKCDYGCGAVLSEHDYTAVVTKSTCTTDGFTTFTCAICGDTYTDDLTKATGHWYGLWDADTQKAHMAFCKNDNCHHMSEANCTEYEVTVDNAGTILAVCPVCGEFSEAFFAEIADAEIHVIGRYALPRGAAIVRGKETPFAGVLYAFTAAYEFAGEVQPFTGMVSISLMYKAEDANFRLVRVDVTQATENTERTEVWTELEFIFEDGKLTFETEHEGLFLLLPLA